MLATKETMASHREAFTRVVIVGGMPVRPLSTQEWVELMLWDCARARRGEQRPQYHGAVNGNAISKFWRNRRFRDAICQADALAADGVPVMWAARFLAGTRIPDRAATTDLFHNLSSAAENFGLSMYFLGATPLENQRAVAEVRRLYPRLRIAGAHHGYFSAGEEEAVVAAIADAKPDVLWVSLGLPREDEFVIRNIANLQGVGWIKTSGGLFNFLSGSRSRAPGWMRDHGLEWLYRLSLEPKRLFWRYATTNVHSLWRMLISTPRDQGTLHSAALARWELGAEMRVQEHPSSVQAHA